MRGSARVVITIQIAGSAASPRRSQSDSVPVEIEAAAGTGAAARALALAFDRRLELGVNMSSVVTVTEKRCSRCKQVKPASAFSRDVRRASGLQAPCRQCATTQALEWRRRNPERSRATNRRYVERHPERHLRSKFGIDPAVKRQMFASQGFVCLACGTTEHGNKRVNGDSGWCLDHDHATGVLRGVLCWHCNVVLGYVRDCPRRLRALADYLDNAAMNTLRLGLRISLESGREAASVIAS